MTVSRKVDRSRSKAKGTAPAPAAEGSVATVPAVAQSTEDAIYATDLDGVILSWNLGAERLFGYATAEVVGHSIEVLYPPGADAEREYIAEGVRQGAPTRRVETLRRRRDGVVIPVEVTVSPVRDAEGRVIGGSSISRDISERRRAQQALAASEARFRSYFELPLVGIAVSAPDTRWMEVNDRLCEMLGYTRDELTALSWRDVTHPDDVAPNMVPFTAVQRGETDSYTIEKRFVRKDGAVIWASLAVRAIRAPDGTLDSLCTVIQDITERHLAEQRIQYLNRMYAVLSDTNQMIVREKDPQATLEAACRIAVNRGNFRMAWIGMLDAAGQRVQPVAWAGLVDGYLDSINIDLSDPGRLTGPSAQCLLTGEHRVCADIATDPAYAPWTAEALHRGYRSSAAFPLKVDGRTVGVFSLYAGELDVFGEEERALLDKLALDIGFALEIDGRETQRRAVEQALGDSEQRFRELADNIDEVFWVVDPATGRVLYVNQAFQQIWGLPSEEAYHNPRHWSDSLHPDDRARVLKAFSARAAQGGYDATYRICRPDGAVRWIHDRGIPLRDATGTVYRIVGTARDITEQQNLEAQLRQAQKMDAVGQLAGGIAHDFNNILAAIMMETDLAAARDGLTPAIRQMITEIRMGAERAAALTRQLLAFSRHQVLQPRRLELNDRVVHLANMLRRIVGEHIGVELGLHPAPLEIQADPGMLDQVLMNLVVNARDAMAGGGRLRIETGAEFGALPTAPAPAERRRFARLTVSDTGTGIPAELLPRIFEPFFTTKEPGKGTGLGLATVFGIVKQHGGFISAVSQPGEGTTFKVLLPALDPEESAASTGEAAPKPAGGTETILLVEDEPMVRRLTRSALERAGYTVLEAPNGVDALEIWAEHRTRGHLLLTDLVMPGGVSGRDLAARLQREAPELRVLYTSGYSSEIAGRDPVLVDGENFIQKPYRLSRLLEVIRQRLT